MDISRDEAFQMMQKWQGDQSHIDIAFRGPDDRVVFAGFVGQISELTSDLIVIKQGEAQFIMALNVIEHFEYADAREFQEYAREWAEKHVAGSLQICGPNHEWVCLLHEMREG